MFNIALLFYLSCVATTIGWSLFAPIFDKIVGDELPASKSTLVAMFESDLKWI